MSDESVNSTVGKRKEEQLEPSSASETVPATSYVPRPQYKRWVDEAEKRNQSISTLISSMVEIGLNQIKLEGDSPSEIIELRQQLQQVQNERDELQRQLESEQRQDYQIGLGKVKELIIKNPGIGRREIANHVMKNHRVFVNEYLDHLEASNFSRRDEGWFPPEEEGEEE